LISIVWKCRPKTVAVEVDLPLEAVARLDRIAAVAGLTSSQVFAVAVAMGLVDEGLDGPDKS
jgi:hypothetical protein